jgi:hypothetical protein
MPRESLARRAGGILLYPLGRVFVFAWVHSSDLPRRVPNLARLTRSAGFAQLQSAAAAWTDQSFELIEDGAPWLDRAGRRVLDRCDTGLNSRAFSFPRDPPYVTCCREVTVVYGFDGSLPGRLAGLAAALGAAGWGASADTIPLRDLDQRKRPVEQVTWSPTEGFGLPAGLATMPPDRRFPLTGWLYMTIDWASRGQSPELVTTRERHWPDDPRAGTATYQPVQVADADVGRLAGQALEQHEHAVAIRIEVTYYLNSNVNARPGRLRKRLLPVWNRLACRVVLSVAGRFVRLPRRLTIRICRIRLFHRHVFEICTLARMFLLG